MSRNGTNGPLGMVIDTATGQVSGTAVEGTANDYAIKGTNTSGFDTTNVDSIVVSATVTTPVLSGTFDIPNTTAGTQYNTDVSALATSGSAPTNWRFTGSQEPTNAVISSAGLITGLAIEEIVAGGYGVQATADGINWSNTLYDADGVSNPPAILPPVFSGTFDLPNANVGQSVNIDISTFYSGGDAPTAYALVGTFPSTTTLVGSNLSIVYDTVATYSNYGFTASNSAGTNAGSDSNLDSVTITAAGTNAMSYVWVGKQNCAI